MIGLNLHICTVHRIQAWRDDLSEADNYSTCYTDIQSWDQKFRTKISLLLGVLSRDHTYISGNLVTRDWSSVRRRCFVGSKTQNRCLNRLLIPCPTREHQRQKQGFTQPRNRPGQQDKNQDNTKRKEKARGIFPYDTHLKRGERRSNPTAKAQLNLFKLGDPDRAARAVPAPPWHKTTEIARSSK